MKKALLLVLVVAFIGCGRDDKNELMSKLLVEKKIIEDSIQITKGGQSIYDSKAKESLRATNDTAIAYPFADTSALYFGLTLTLNERLKQVDFSIDSLSKMK